MVPNDPHPWDRWLEDNDTHREKKGWERYWELDDARRAGPDAWRWRLNWFAQQYPAYAPDDKSHGHPGE